MRAFVVPDLHGKVELAERILAAAGIWDGFRRDPDVFVVQVGDLANCVAASREDDLRSLRRAPRLFDTVLVGNHEHPYFGGPAFSGFFAHADVGRELTNLARVGLFVPSIEVDGVLVSHAGATVSTAVGWPTAEVADRELRRAWRDDPRSHSFSAIGRARGGIVSEGGILWADYSEPKTFAFSQVFGHTVGREVRLDRFRSGGDRDERFHCCLDLGGGKNCSRFAGAWLNDGALEVLQVEV